MSAEVEAQGQIDIQYDHVQEGNPPTDVHLGLLWNNYTLNITPVSKEQMPNFRNKQRSRPHVEVLESL